MSRAISLVELDKSNIQMVNRAINEYRAVPVCHSLLLATKDTNCNINYCKKYRLTLTTLTNAHFSYGHIYTLSAT